jgi:hypothetical protein
MRDDERVDADVEARMARLRGMTGPLAFDPGFVDRVLARAAVSRRPSDALQAAFFRIAPFGIAATLLLSTFNLLATRSSDQPFISRLLSLPNQTVAESYALDGDLSAWER